MSIIERKREERKREKEELDKMAKDLASRLRIDAKETETVESKGQESKPKLQYGLSVRLCVALLGLGIGMTLMWSEQWSKGRVWLPIALITISVVALVLILRAIKKKKAERIK